MATEHAEPAGDPAPGRGAERVLAYLRAASTPVEVVELVRALGLHPTTVRQHLAHLAERGRVSVRTVPRSGRGRPRLAYEALQLADNPYEFLSGALAEAVRDAVPAREVGRRAGRRAAADRAGAGVVEVISSEAARLGFAPTVEASERGLEVRLGRCPFVAVAEHEPAVVCELHLGLAEGVVEEMGGDLVVEGLQVGEPRSGGCAIRLCLPR